MICVRQMKFSLTACFLVKRIDKVIFFGYNNTVGKNGILFEKEDNT